ncbi:diguanylate cyclase domain-containing protein [Thiobacillus denitrificans]|uniref:diguanylate cyclase domain-containing protein n=1 Tax=Thiobacillus denitrificans TaxID=36861 RepID=UPI00039A9402|nr:diguanylate cyclase [Thiobacillus denitrificans]
MPMQRGFSLTTGAAFVTLIVLICGLALNGLLQLQTLGEQMRTVVENHNRKIDLITQTQVAAHIRTDSLFRMALTDDPFERDAHFMEFNRAGFLVGSGRNALRQMGFSTAEQRSFDTQTRLVNDIELVQGRVIDLLNSELSTDARRVLMREAIPIQQAFNLQLADMRNLYQQANFIAQQQAQQTYRRTFLLTLAFGIAAVALALLIARHTLRKIGQKSRQIDAQMMELERSRAALREEATHDPLTGLANRRLFYDRLQQAIRHAHRYGGKVGILYVDMDRFKDINDRHGHHIGDAVLMEVAQQLRDCVRESDSVARLGGDEFVVLLEGVQGRHDCVAAALKIEHSLAHSTRFDDLHLGINASIGQAVYPDDGSDEDALIRAADAAMYRVKSGCESERQRCLSFQ